MYTIRRFAPHIYSILIFGVFLWMYIQPDSIFGLFSVQDFSSRLMLLLYLFLLALLVIVIMAIGAGRGILPRFHFSFFPVVLLSAGYFLFLLTDYQPFLLVLTIIIPLFIWFWLENLYLFWQRTALYQAYTLERIASYTYVMTIFIVVYALTAAQTLVQIPFWGVLSLFVIAFGGLLFDLFLLHKFDGLESFVVACLGVLLASQLLFVLTLLPTHFSFISSVLCLFYYLWGGLGRIILGREKARKTQVTYITVSSLGFLSLLVSSLLISV